MEDSYASNWLELRKSGRELLEEKAEELIDVRGYETALKDVWHDIVIKFDFFSDEDGDHCYYDSKVYAYEHFDELKEKYSVEEIDWLTQWQTIIGVLSEATTDLSRVREIDLPKLPDLILYLAIRGPIPEKFPVNCSYALVIENIESAMRADVRQRRVKELVEYFKEHPEVGDELRAGQIPKSYASELYPKGIEIHHLVSYWKNTREVPSKCGIHARRLVREYIEKFGELPKDESECLSRLGVVVVEEVRAHMTRLRGTLRREINHRQAQAYLREHPELKEELVGAG